jgi:hypothetical protein
MRRFITPDLIFSYWLFFWALIYAVLTPKTLGLSPYVYESMNPIVGLWIGMTYDILELLYLWINYSSHISILLKLTLIIIIIKIIPIFLLMHKKVRVVNNLFFVLGLFIIYNIYLYANNTNLKKVYTGINKSLRDNLNNTPLMWVLSKIAGLFSSP